MATELIEQKVAYKAYPSSFCAGVRWGIDHLKIITQQHGTVYVPNLDGLVHNNLVKAELEALGVRHVKIKDIPEGAVVANSMHGRSPLLTRELVEKGCLHYDLSCPLVDVVRSRLVGAISEARKSNKIAKLLYVCKNTDHPEPRSLIELAPNNVVPVTSEQVLIDYQVRPDEMYFADSQTTINTVKATKMVEQYGNKFPGLKVAAGVDGCFATYNRQLALTRLFEARIEKLAVFGSPSSSNTTELVKIAKASNIPVEFMETAALLNSGMVDGFNRVGVHAGASVPPDEADRAMEILAGWGYQTRELRVADEPTTFSIKPRVYDYRGGQMTDQILQLIQFYH